MASFYATRTQQIAHNVTERQLLKFPTRASRDNFCTFEDATTVTAREAGKLQIADVWRTLRGTAGVFHVARYVA